MEIALDSHDTLLPKNKNRTKREGEGLWAGGWDKGT